MAEKKERLVFKSITGMRGLACLFIVCFHYFCLYIDDRGLGMNALPFAPHSEFFFTYSKNAVELFFLIAGFLTAYHYRDRIAGMSPWAYFKKHYGKLLIPSVIVNLWAFANAMIQLRAIPGSEAYIPAATPLRLVLSVLMINTGWFTSSGQTGLPVNSTMWFIDVLLLCYLLYYAVRKLARNTYVYLSICTLLAILGWVCLEHTPKLPLLWHYNGRGYAPFFIGVLLCEFQLDADEKVRKKTSCVWGSFILGVMLLRLILGFEKVFGDVGGSAYVRYFEFIAAPGLLLVSLNIGFVIRFLEWKPFLWLGVIATAIYYVHNNLMEDYAIINDLNGNPVSFSSPFIFLFVLLSVVLFAALVHLLKGKITKRKDRQISTT